MGMALAVTVAVGLLGSSLTWLWFRMSHERHGDPGLRLGDPGLRRGDPDFAGDRDIARLVKQRRSNFEENVQTAEKLIRKG